MRRTTWGCPQNTVIHYTSLSLLLMLGDGKVVTTWHRYNWTRWTMRSFQSCSLWIAAPFGALLLHYQQTLHLLQGYDTGGTQYSSICSIRRVTSQEGEWIYLSISAMLALACLCITGPGGLGCHPILGLHIAHSVLGLSSTLVWGATAFQFSSYFWPYCLRFLLFSYLSFWGIWFRPLLFSLSPLFQGDLTLLFSWSCSWLPYLVPAALISPWAATCVLTWCVTGSSNPTCNTWKTPCSSNLLSLLSCTVVRGSITHSAVPVRPCSHS